MIRIAAETPWYDLFSRGARDWLRHNQKVREAVKGGLPELLAGSDLMTGPSNRTVMVPVKFLEHARLRLAHAGVSQVSGQGRGEPGQGLQPGREPGADQRSGGTGEGEIRFVVELKVDEIVDWLWEELKLPELKPRRSATMDEPDFVREGWNRRGARSRLDRRRTLKESIKRKAVQQDAVAIIDDDLRFRQLVKRASAAMNAAVIFALAGQTAAGGRDAARAAPGDIAAPVNYAGYVETGGLATFRPRETQLAEIFAELKTAGRPVGTSHLGCQDDVWGAIREFFSQE